MAPCRPGAADGEDAASASRMGSTNAAVLPVPVGAQASTSRPASTWGMTSAWMGVGTVYPSATSAWTTLRERPSPRKGEASMAAGSTATAGGASSCAPGREASEADGSKGRLDWAREWRPGAPGTKRSHEGKTNSSRQPLRTCAGRNQRTIPRYRAIGRARRARLVASRETPSSRILHLQEVRTSIEARRERVNAPYVARPGPGRKRTASKGLTPWCRRGRSRRASARGRCSRWAARPSCPRWPGRTSRRTRGRTPTARPS